MLSVLSVFRVVVTLEWVLMKQTDNKRQHASADH
jgi:hypothetical protein